MAVGMAMIGFSLMAWLGLINPAQTIYASARVLWLSALVSGALFGVGIAQNGDHGGLVTDRVGGPDLGFT